MREYQERSANDPLLLDFAVCPEVHQETETIPGCLQVIVDLGPVFVSQLRDGLDLHDDFIETSEVGLIGLLERPTLVGQLEFRLGDEGYAP